VLEVEADIGGMSRRVLTLAAIVAVLSIASGAAATRVLITSKDIKNGTIRPVDLSAAAKKTMRGKQGIRGLRGAQGPTGPRGFQGNPGPPGFSDVLPNDEVGSISPNASGTVSAVCIGGYKAVGGGFEATDPSLSVYASKPSASGFGWDVSARNAGNDPAALWAYVLCAG
jgi:hypothetical protein